MKSSKQSGKSAKVKRAKESLPVAYSQQRKATRQEIDQEADVGIKQIYENNPAANENEKLMLELNFEDEYKIRRVITSTDSKNKISGCLFCFIGLIVMGFGIFLCDRGAKS